MKKDMIGIEEILGPLTEALLSSTILKENRMAKGKEIARIKRRPEHFYFVDGKGSVREIKRKKRKKSKR